MFSAWVAVWHVPLRWQDAYGYMIVSGLSRLLVGPVIELLGLGVQGLGFRP